MYYVAENCMETGSALGCFTVNNFIVLNDQAVYAVIKLPLEPILSTNMTNIYTSPCDYLHLSEIRKKLTGVITTESTLKLYSPYDQDSMNGLNWGFKI